MQLLRVRRWQPVENMDLRRAAVQLVRSLADAVTETSGATTLGQIAHGTSGHAVFLSYVHTVLGDERYRTQAIDSLARAAEWARTRRQWLLYEGSLGVAWAIQHVEVLLGELEDTDPLADYDRALLHFLRSLRGPVVSELMRGVAGAAVYCLERMPRDEAQAALTEVVRLLDVTSTETRAGLTWMSKGQGPTFSGPAFQPSYCNLGIAHGVPGTMSLLTAMHIAGIDGAGRLLEASLPWLDSIRTHHPDRLQYPLALDAAGHPAGHARLAWCYGDLGIAVTFANAGSALRDKRWSDVALDLALGAARLRDQTTPGWPTDASLCHGTAGIAHLFGRLATSLQHPALHDARQYWIHETLRYADEHGGVGLLTSSRQPTSAGTEIKMEWQPDFGVLTGAAGIGLSLLASGSELSPDWDRLLAL